MKKLLLIGLVLLSSGMIYAPIDDSADAEKAKFVEKINKVMNDLGRALKGFEVLYDNAAVGKLNFGSDEERSKIKTKVFDIQNSYAGTLVALLMLKDFVEAI